MKALRPTRTSLDTAAVRFAETIRHNNGDSQSSGASAAITNAVAKFSYAKLSNNVAATVNEPTSTAAATTATSSAMIPPPSNTCSTGAPRA